MASERLRTESFPSRSGTPRAVSDITTAALIAAIASVIGSVLTFIVGLRSVKRSIATSNGVPLGALVESRLTRMEAQLDRIESSLGDVRERLAFTEGRAQKAPVPRRSG